MTNKSFERSNIIKTIIFIGSFKCSSVQIFTFKCLIKPYYSIMGLLSHIHHYTGHIGVLSKLSYASLISRYCPYDMPIICFIKWYAMAISKLSCALLISSNRYIKPFHMVH